MKTNILRAIINIVDNNISSIKAYKELQYKIRINNAGEALENLVKDALCWDFNLALDQRIVSQSEYFSYLGNQNNPPDLIIRGGDAFEIKKIETNGGVIALNSSFPKNKLYRNSNMLTEACKNCEKDWIEKDICYIIGAVDRNQDIKSLWFVYGDCYCAMPATYTSIKDKITEAIDELSIELSETNEIAKIKKIDPLGITDLRVRGMWGIKHPSKVFDYVVSKNSTPHIRALMLRTKFDSFDAESKNNLSTKSLIRDVKICNPNNPADLLDAILIEYEFNPTKTNYEQ